MACTAVAASQGVAVLTIEEASPLGQAATYGLALTPLVAAFATRLSTTHRMRGWGFRRVGGRTLLLAWLVGLVPVLAAYAAVWLSRAAGYDGDLRSAILAATVMVLPYLVLAIAEDIGWRGLLVARLAELAQTRIVYLVSGVLWSLSHVGLLVFLGGTPAGVSTVYAVAMFTIATTALGSILAAMQLRWGLWPGVLTHATVNAVLYQFADPSTVQTSPWTPWIATETGLAYAVAMLLAALVFLRWFGIPARHQSPTSDVADAD
jgi:membrane protease YdiL (CAAX protease family)